MPASWGKALGAGLAKVMELQEDGGACWCAQVGTDAGVVGEVTVRGSSGDSSEGRALKTGEAMISPDIGRGTRLQVPVISDQNSIKAVTNVLIISLPGRAALWHPANRQPRTRSFGRGTT